MRKLIVTAAIAAAVLVLAPVAAGAQESQRPDTVALMSADAGTMELMSADAGTMELMSTDAGTMELMSADMGTSELMTDASTMELMRRFRSNSL